MTENIASAIIGAFVGFIASALTLRFSYKQLFAQTVSQNRMDWINNFREEISIVVGTAKYLNSINQQNNCSNICGTTHQYDEQILCAEKARVKLLTRLNSDASKPGNEFNEIFQDALRKIKFDGKDEDKTLNKLELLAKEILEPEWARVKKEARGNVRK